MDQNTPPPPPSPPATSSSPLLQHPSPPSPPRRTPLAALLSRSLSPRGPPALVRDAAALHLEQRRADWAYSRPVVALDIAWNLAFAVAAAAVVAATVGEKPNVPVRVWILGYALQCVVHVVLVWGEYRRRARGVGEDDGVGGGEDSEDEDVGTTERRHGSLAKRCESFNTMASFVWWIIGFYWIVSGGEILLQAAPRLYWLAVVFLAFDVFFAIFCVALACVIGIALCCCLPCIIAILYAVAGQEGASDADISILPRFRYKYPSDNEQKTSAEAGTLVPITINNGASSVERSLLHEDAQCCICISPYDDGAEVQMLPCNHHFHSPCVVKWLRIHATCPLCKYNILKGNYCA